MRWGLTDTLFALAMAGCLALLVWTLLPPPVSAEIERSSVQVHRFHRLTGYPQGRLGYVVDHIIPLACGGPDHPLNMQWQTAAEAKATDRWNRFQAVELDSSNHAYLPSQ